jgi:hypothetical protein
MKSLCFKTLKEFQKINHFPGTFQIGRKDRLWKNLYRLMTKFGKKEYVQNFTLLYCINVLVFAYDNLLGRLYVMKRVIEIFLQANKYISLQISMDETKVYNRHQNRD